MTLSSVGIKQMKKAAFFLIIFLSSTSVLAEGIFIWGGGFDLRNDEGCPLTFCAKVTQTVELAPGVTPINSNVETASEPFFNPGRYVGPEAFQFTGYFFDIFVTSNGSRYIDSDVIASQFTTSGFYLLTKSFEPGAFPVDANFEIVELDLLYDEINNTVTISFIAAANEVINSVPINQWALYMIQDEGLTEELSNWRVEGFAPFGRSLQRRVVVNALEDLQRLDVHAVIAGQEFNFEMNEIYSGFYTWEIPPTIEDDAEISVFFNYTTTDGVGVDTALFSETVGDLNEIFTTTINSGNDTITLNDEVTYKLVGPEGVDQIVLDDTAFISYSVNGGNVFGYPLKRVVTFEDALRVLSGLQFEFPVDLVTGDELTYEVQYSFKGVPYVTPKVTTLIQ